EEDIPQEYDENLKTRAEQEHEESLKERLAAKGIESANNALNASNDLLPPQGSPLEIQLKHLQLISNEEPER
ncbi:hypothetical protein, partial [Bacillus spizizenii]|uniref:hypothetical protein n=1 Tax=Bacillus spizizenii TaxID=96241 RepID=UPI001933AE0B